MPAYTKSKRKKSAKPFRNQSRSQIIIFMLVFAVAGSYLLWKSFAATNRVKVNAPAVAIANAGSTSKYWIATTDGGIFSQGGATFYGSMGGKHLNQPVTSMATRPQYDGYWLQGGDCGVFAFGGAKYQGRYAQSATDFCRAIVSTPSGNGYWQVSRYGHIFAYGDAAAYSGSIDASIKKTNTGAYGIIPGLPANGIVAAARTVSGKGLILLAANGATYAFGDAPYHGNAPVNYAAGKRTTAIATDNKNGYIVAANDGAIYGLGGQYRGGANTIGALQGSVISVAMTPDSGGYWELGQDGGVFTYGNAKFEGNVLAPTTKVCWDGKTYLSTQACPAKPAPPASATTPTSGGSSGTAACNAVCKTQGLLNSHGERLNVDGILGPLTAAACGRHPTDCAYINWKSGGSGGTNGGGTGRSGGSSFNSTVDTGSCNTAKATYNNLRAEYIQSDAALAAAKKAGGRINVVEPYYTDIRKRLNAFFTHLGWIRSDGIEVNGEGVAASCRNPLDSDILQDFNYAIGSQNYVKFQLAIWDKRIDNAYCRRYGC